MDVPPDVDSSPHVTPLSARWACLKDCGLEWNAAVGFPQRGNPAAEIGRRIGVCGMGTVPLPDYFLKSALYLVSIAATSVVLWQYAVQELGIRTRP